MLTFDAILRWGRWVMVSFGFGDVIDRIEKYYGVKTTKAIVGILTIAAVLFVVGLATSQVIYPFAIWIGDIVTGNPEIESARSGISSLILVVWIASVLAVIVSFFQAKAHFSRLPVMIEEVRQLITSCRQSIVRAEHATAQAGEAYEEARAVYLELAKHAKDAGLPLNEWLAKAKSDRAAVAAEPASSQDNP